MKINTENIIFTTNNKFIKDDIEYDLLDFPCEENFIQPAFDYKELRWTEVATLDNIIESYYICILNKTKELENLKSAGFDGNKNYIDLETEIEELRKKYLNANHELALQIENRLK